jgi:hypothetical protein
MGLQSAVTHCRDQHQEFFEFDPPLSEDETTFKCDTCPMRVPKDRNVLKRHTDTHYPPHICQIIGCGKKFKMNTDYVSHVKTAHANIAKRVMGGKKYGPAYWYEAIRLFKGWKKADGVERGPELVPRFPTGLGSSTVGAVAMGTGITFANAAYLLYRIRVYPEPRRMNSAGLGQTLSITGAAVWERILSTRRMYAAARSQNGFPTSTPESVIASDRTTPRTQANLMV